MPICCQLQAMECQCSWSGKSVIVSLQDVYTFYRIGTKSALVIDRTKQQVGIGPTRSVGSLK